MRKATSHIQAAQEVVQSQVHQESIDVASEGGMWNAVTSLTKQRVKLNMKLLGNFSGTQASSHMKEDKPTYREQFVAPEMSMLSYFLMKPSGMKEFLFKLCIFFYLYAILGDASEDGYDTGNSDVSDEEEEDDEDVFADDLKINQKQLQKQNTEHSNINSISWNIMRLAIVKIAQHQLQTFINIAGIEIQGLYMKKIFLCTAY